MPAGYELPMRVHVYSGDGTKDMGYGTYENDVTVWAFRTRDGGLISLTDAETKPSDEIIKIAMEQGASQVSRMEENPRIVLDTGEIVYGCQVWWQPVPKQIVVPKIM